MASRTFAILARNHSVGGGTGLDTQIDLQPGQLLVINASPRDTWSASPDAGTCNANGSGNPFGEDLGIYQRGDFRFLYGSLVGSLDEGKTFFPIGTQCQITVLAEGRLRLYFWDPSSADNLGEVRAVVQYYDGPRV